MQNPFGCNDSDRLLGAATHGVHQMANGYGKRWMSILTIVCVLIVGCGGSGRSPLGKVTGTVTYKGEPLLEGTIVFHNPRGRSATGRIIDGTIEDVLTYDVINDGAPVGHLAVTIHPVKTRPTVGPGKSQRPQVTIPSRYGIPADSGLTADIEPGVNELTFELTD